MERGCLQPNEVVQTKHTKHAGQGRREGGRTAKVERVRDLEMGEINDRETEPHGGRLPKTEAEKKRESQRDSPRQNTGTCTYKSKYRP